MGVVVAEALSPPPYEAFDLSSTSDAIMRGSGITGLRPWVKDQAECQPLSGNWLLSVWVMSG